MYVSLVMTLGLQIYCMQLVNTEMLYLTDWRRLTSMESAESLTNPTPGTASMSLPETAGPCMHSWDELNLAYFLERAKPGIILGKNHFWHSCWEEPNGPFRSNPCTFEP